MDSTVSWSSSTSHVIQSYFTEPMHDVKSTICSSSSHCNTAVKTPSTSQLSCTESTKKQLLLGLPLTKCPSFIKNKKIPTLEEALIYLLFKCRGKEAPPPVKTTKRVKKKVRKDISCSSESSDSNPPKQAVFYKRCLFSKRKETHSPKAKENRVRIDADNSLSRLNLCRCFFCIRLCDLLSINWKSLFLNFLLKLGLRRTKREVKVASVGCNLIKQYTESSSDYKFKKALFRLRRCEPSQSVDSSCGKKTTVIEECTPRRKSSEKKVYEELCIDKTKKSCSKANKNTYDARPVYVLCKKGHLTKICQPKDRSHRYIGSIQ